MTNLLKAMAAAGGGAAGGYEVENSVRLNSGYMSITPSSAGNQKTWSFSTWAKRANLSGGSGQYIMGCEVTTGYNTSIVYGGSDDLEAYHENGAGPYIHISDAKHRDPGAWEHLLWVLDTTQATEANRLKLYRNGVEVTSFSTETYGGLNIDCSVNSTSQHEIGRSPAAAGGYYFDGYLSQTAMLDGVVATPTDFGEFDSEGEWRPIDITGLDYTGTNSYLLDYAVAPGTDDGAGTDVSGNGNHFSDSNLVAADQVSDSPTNNFCVMSSIAKTTGVTLSDGNLNLVYDVDESGAVGTVMFDIEDTDGYYYECEFDVVGNSGSIGVANGDANPPAVTPGNDDGTWLFGKAGGILNGSGSYQPNATWDSGTNGAIGAGNYGVVAAKAGAVWYGTVPGGGGTITWYNGATKGEIEAGTTTNAAVTGLTGLFTAVAVRGSTTTTTQIYNFGQQDYQATDIPSGLKNISTANLSPLDFDPADHHQVELVNHDGTSTNFTLAWDADVYDTLFIIKNRDSSEAFLWVNGLSGYDKYLVSDTTTAITTDADVISVSGTTITLGSSAALSSDNYVIECHRAGAAGGVSNGDGDITTTVSANTVSGFSLVTGTLGASASTVYTLGHGLSAAPEMIVMREPTAIGSHKVYNVGNDATAPEDYEVVLNTTGTRAAGSYAGNAAPTPSLFSMSTASWGTSKAILAYCWAGVEGYSAFGSYEGNNSSTGPVLNTGTNANSVIFKSIDGVKQWSMMRSATESGNTGATNQMFPDQTQTESGAGTEDVDFISSGIKLRTTDNAINAAETYIYGMWGTPTVNKSETPAKAR